MVDLLLDQQPLVDQDRRDGRRCLDASRDIVAGLQRQQMVPDMPKSAFSATPITLCESRCTRSGVTDCWSSTANMSTGFRASLVGEPMPGASDAMIAAVRLPASDFS